MVIILDFKNVRFLLQKLLEGVKKKSMSVLLCMKPCTPLTRPHIFPDTTTSLLTA